MSFQAYLDNIKAKTGKTPDDFRALAAQKGLTKYGDVLAWLKTDFGLGHGHANAIAQLLVNADKLEASPDDKLAAHFTGDKAKWREAYDAARNLRLFNQPQPNASILVSNSKALHLLSVLNTPERGTTQ